MASDKAEEKARELAIELGELESRVGTYYQWVQHNPKAMTLILSALRSHAEAAYREGQREMQERASKVIRAMRLKALPIEERKSDE